MLEVQGTSGASARVRRCLRTWCLATRATIGGRVLATENDCRFHASQHSSEAVTVRSLTMLQRWKHLFPEIMSWNLGARSQDNGDLNLIAPKVLFSADTELHGISSTSSFIFALFMCPFSDSHA